MVNEEVKTTFDNGKVIISNQADVETFLQIGFGTKLDDKPDLALSSWEALYLLSNNRIRVIEAETEEELNFQSLFEKYRSESLR